MDRDERIGSLIDLMKTEPNDVFLNYVLGVEYAAIGKAKEAIVQFHKVIHLDEQYIAAYYQQGKLLAENGEKEKALVLLRKGSEIATQQNNSKARSEFEEAIFMLED